MSKQLSIELDLFVNTVIPVIRYRVAELGVAEAIQVYANYRVGDRHSTDCQAYNAMYRIYGCDHHVRNGGRRENVCRFRL